jgi:hypothetical protein
MPTGLYALGARTLPDPFVPPKMAAWAACRPEKTIWTWKRKELIACACDVETRQIVVRLEDAVAEASKREARFATTSRPGRRRRRPKEIPPIGGISSPGITPR